jgi:hypothetical protein
MLGSLATVFFISVLEIATKGFLWQNFGKTHLLAGWQKPVH